MVRSIFLFSVILSVSGCASKPWQSVDNPPKIMLPDVQVLAGGHCESSAIANALHYLGYPINEASIVGGGGTNQYSDGDVAITVTNTGSLDFHKYVLLGFQMLLCQAKQE